MDLYRDDRDPPTPHPQAAADAHQACMASCMAWKAIYYWFDFIQGDKKREGRGMAIKAPSFQQNRCNRQRLFAVAT